MFNLAWFPLMQATWETIYMVFISGFLSIVFGLVLGVILYLTHPQHALENKIINRILGLLVNMTRSIPFIILMICIIPFTRLLIGTSIGTNAAIVPLTIAATAFFARISEGALLGVAHGLLEAAHAMGATTLQIVTKVLIPESLPALIRGATLTMIGLVGYSAMAGVVGGGGLGELAINYGYQQFDLSVMIATMVILLGLVQLLQWCGDFLAKHRLLKPVYIASLLLWIVCLASQFWVPSSQAMISLRVGVMSGSSEQIMKVAQQVAQEKFGIHLEVVAFSDYVQPNTALNNGSIDANIFQHAPYLEAQSAAHHYQIIPIAKTFVYPMGFYSKKLKSIAELREGAVIAIPNDPSNQGRALLVLQKAGLIQLKAGTGTLATVRDIISNPHQLQFKLIDAAQAPRVLDDVDLAAITNDFVGPAGLTINQAVLKEGNDSPYANLIVVRMQDQSKPVFAKLIEIMHSQPVVEETEKVYPDGAAIPAWKP